MKKIIWLLSLLSILSMFGLALPHFVSADTTGASFAGDISSYMQTQKTTLTSIFDSWYAKVYQELSKTWLSILNTTNYQSLVCLGIFPAESILATLQKDKLSLKTSISKDISELENRVAALEEKNTLQKGTNVDLRDGSSYDIEKWLLKADIDAMIAKDKWFIQAFQSGYISKINSFIINFVQYSAQNSALVNAIATKISKVNYIFSGYNSLQDKVVNMYQAMGIADVMDKFTTLKNTAMTTLGAQLDPIIALKLKVMSFIPALSWELAVQKEAAIKQYMLDMNEYFATAFQKRYDRVAYTKLVDSITKFQKTYYTNSRLNCSNVIGGANDDTGLAVLAAQMNKVSTNISSGIIAAQAGMDKEAFKTSLLSGFQKIFNTAVIKQKVTSFQNNITSVIANLKKLLIPTPVSTGSRTDGSADTNLLPLGFIFTKPLTLGETSSDAGALQQVLKSIDLYNGPINNTFTQATKDALYSYQLQKGILTPDNDISLRGLLGPVTRVALNKLLSK